MINTLPKSYICIPMYADLLSIYATLLLCIATNLLSNILCDI